MYTEKDYYMLFKKLNGYMLLGQHTLDELIQFRKTIDFASYSYTFKYTELLVEALGHEPTEDEIIMIVNGGLKVHSHSCIVNTKNKTGFGKVNTY